MIMECKVHPEHFTLAFDAYQAFFRRNAKNSAVTKVPAVRLTAAEDKLMLMGVDNFIGAALQIDIPCQTETVGEVIVDIRDVAKHRKRLKKDGVTDFERIWCDEPAHGWGMVGISGLMLTGDVVPYGMFPKIDNETFSEEVAFDKDILAAVLKQVQFAVASTDAGGQLNHILMSPNQDVAGRKTGITDVVATNKSQLAIARTATRMPTPIVVPGWIAANLSTLFKGCDAGLKLGLHAVNASSPDLRSTRALLTGTDAVAGLKTQLYLAAARPTSYPHYRTILPTWTVGARHEFLVEREPFLQGVRDTISAETEITRITYTGQTALTLNSLPKSVSVYEQDKHVAETVVSLPLLRIRENAVPLTFRCDTELLLDILNAFNGCERILMDFQEPSGPVAFRNPATASDWKSAPFLALLAPFGVCKVGSI